MLVGNKSDRATEREVLTQDGRALARELGCEFVETSAKHGIHVEKAFYDVVRVLRYQRQQTTRRTGNANLIGRDYGFGKSSHGKDDGRRSRCIIL